MDTGTVLMLPRRRSRLETNDSLTNGETPNIGKEIFGGDIWGRDLLGDWGCPGRGSLRRSWCLGAARGRPGRTPWCAC